MKRILLIGLMVLIASMAFGDITVSGKGLVLGDADYKAGAAVSWAETLGLFGLSAGVTLDMPGAVTGWSAGIDYTLPAFSIGCDLAGTMTADFLTSLTIPVTITLTDWLSFGGGVALAPMADDIFTGAEVSGTITKGIVTATIGYQVNDAYVINNPYEVKGLFVTGSVTF